MALKNIRDNIAAKTGYHPDSSSADKLYLNAEINKIAREFHNSNDLVGSLKEIIVFWDDENKMVSFPHYVEEVRGARYYDSPFKITLRDIRPRYATDAYGIQIEDFREVDLSTLAVQLEDWSVLKFAYPEGETETENLVISVVGETPVSSHTEEQVTLVAGQNSITTTNNFINAPRFILKNRVTKFDLIVTNVEEEEVAIIPNNQLASQYSIWQVRDDRLQGQISANSIEVLFKTRFYELVNDYDEFLQGKYDDAIIWKFLAEFYGTQEGKEELRDNAEIMWQRKIGGINKSKAKGKKSEMQSVNNKFFGLFNRDTWRNAHKGN